MPLSTYHPQSDEYNTASGMSSKQQQVRQCITIAAHVIMFNSLWNNDIVQSMFISSGLFTFSAVPGSGLLFSFFCSSSFVSFPSSFFSSFGGSGLGLGLGLLSIGLQMSSSSCCWKEKRANKVWENAEREGGREGGMSRRKWNLSIMKSKMFRCFCQPTWLPCKLSIGINHSAKDKTNNWRWY